MKKFLFLILIFLSVNTYAQHLDNIEFGTYKKIEKMRKDRYKKGSKKTNKFTKKPKRKVNRKIQPFFRQKTNFSYIKENELNIC